MHGEFHVFTHWYLAIPPPADHRRAGELRPSGGRLGPDAHQPAGHAVEHSQDQGLRRRLQSGSHREQHRRAERARRQPQRSEFLLG